MRHLISTVVAAGGLCLMSVAASAQYRYQPPRDYYNYNRGYRSQSALSAIENTLAANRVSLNSMLSADQWNYYAAETFPDFTPPAPEDLFPGLANVGSSRHRYENASHDPVSFNTWWSAIQPYIENSRY